MKEIATINIAPRWMDEVRVSLYWLDGRIYATLPGYGGGNPGIRCARHEVGDYIYREWGPCGGMWDLRWAE